MTYVKNCFEKIINEYRGSLNKSLLLRIQASSDDFALNSKNPLLAVIKELRGSHQYSLAYQFTFKSLQCLQSMAAEITDESVSERQILLSSYGVPDELIKNYLELKQAQGLLLNDLDSHYSALTIFEELYAMGFEDEETVANLASTYKSLGIKETDLQRQQEYYRKSRGYYNKTYSNQSESYWSGINVATLNMLLEDVEEVCHLCEHIKKTCMALAEDVWSIGTIAEAELILFLLSGNQDQYRVMDMAYRKAARLATGYNEIKSLRKNAFLLLDPSKKNNAIQLNEDQIKNTKDFLKEVLFIPPVILFSGHIIDNNSTSSRFPVDNIDVVKSAIHKVIAKVQAQWGYSSAACGSDLLFIESFKDLGKEINIILPFLWTSFIETSIAIGDTEFWVDKFTQIKNTVDAQLGEHFWQCSPQPGKYFSEYSEYSNLIAYGLAESKARHLDTELVLLAVWDGKAGKGRGGTADIVKLWAKLGHAVTVIDPMQPSNIHFLTEKTIDDVFSDGLEAGHDTSVFKSIVNINMSDMDQFSVEQKEILKYILITIASRCIDEYDEQHWIKKNWGTNLAYMMFSNLHHAFDFSMALINFFENQWDHNFWQRYGFIEPIRVNALVHYLPFKHNQEKTDQENYHRHSSSENELVTDISGVFATLASVSYCKLYKSPRYSFEFAGQFLSTPYAVNHLFHVRDDLTNT